MGNCMRPMAESSMKRRGDNSLLAELNDSRHVMMRRSKAKGVTQSEDGSFYRPREDITLFSATLPPPLSQFTMETTNDKTSYSNQTSRNETDDCQNQQATSDDAAAADESPWRTQSPEPLSLHKTLSELSSGDQSSSDSLRNGQPQDPPKPLEYIDAEKAENTEEPLVTEEMPHYDSLDHHQQSQTHDCASVATG